MTAPALFASLDLGGTRLKAALGSAAGELAAELTEPTEAHEGPDAVLRRMAALVDRLAEQEGVRPQAVAVGCPGWIDRESGESRYLPNLPGAWRGVPVGPTLSQSLGCPVYLLNDVRMATLGELIFGHGREHRNLVFFALGTGIGGGVVIDGRLRLGPLGSAGEIGHQVVIADGPRCGCGSRGCLETVASGPAITAEGVRLLLSGQAPELHALVSGDTSRVTTETMAEAARLGDESVRLGIERAARYLGLAAANLVVTLHPSLVVLGGGVAGIGDLLFDTVRSTLHETVRVFPAEDVKVEPSALGSRAGVLGGIALAAQHGRVEARREGP